MLKSPKKTKYKAPHLHLSNKGLKGYKNSPNAVLIKTKEDNLMSPQQREVCRRILSKPVKEQYGSLNIRFFPHLSRSKKPLQTRMGKGKGKHDKWVAPIKAGSTLMEIIGPVPKKILSKVFKKVAYRMPINTKMVKPKIKKNIIMDKRKIIMKK